ncbi:MAG: DUF802 domain-containing protein [Alcanivorax sp.]|nr:DUF802 domain-containing protein [Alcanivorax sp.]
MRRFLFALPFVIGALAVGWIGASFLGSNTIAFTATLVIALVYAFGFVELLSFRRASDTLATRLTQLPDSREALGDWLATLPASLRHAVRRRIDGQPVALPGPTLSPYLSGLLVMLGLLGTFIGMIVTLRGAATALQGSTELHAIRGALAAPIEGLSLAFGTSIAGVASSAMLGLAATLSRRDRLLISRQLDSCIEQSLYRFSRQHQREAAYAALHNQSQLFPQLVSTLQGLSEHMTQMSGQLAGDQQRFHDSVAEHYTRLADSVGQSLKDTLADSSRLAAQSVQPIMEASLGQLNQQVEQTHQQLHAITEKQLESLTERFRDTTEQAARHWQQGLAEHQQTSADQVTLLREALDGYQTRFEDNSEALLGQVRDTQIKLGDASEKQLLAISEQFRDSSRQAADHWQAGLARQQQSSTDLVSELRSALQAHNQQFEHSANGLLQGQQNGFEQLLQQVGEQLTALRDQEARRGDNAGERLAGLETTVTEHLTRLGTALEAPMTRLIETASQTPKAAAEVITQLREEMARNSERDNQLLEERHRLMRELDALLGTQRDAASAQRDAIDTLIRSASDSLAQVGDTFARQVEQQAERLNQVAGDVTGSAAEVASLGDAFGEAVQQFSSANGTLIDHLQQVEEALARSSQRSDEQLAYYVEQAREVIELSMTSQKDVLEALGTLQQPDTSRPATEVN